MIKNLFKYFYPVLRISVLESWNFVFKTWANGCFQHEGHVCFFFPGRITLKAAEYLMPSNGCIWFRMTTLMYSGVCDLSCMQLSIHRKLFFLDCCKDFFQVSWFWWVSEEKVVSGTQSCGANRGSLKVNKHLWDGLVKNAGSALQLNHQRIKKFNPEWHLITMFRFVCTGRQATGITEDEITIDYIQLLLILTVLSPTKGTLHLTWLISHIMTHVITTNASRHFNQPKKRPAGRDNNGGDSGYP